MLARDRGVRDFFDGLPVTRCPFAKGKDRQAWVAGWYEARKENPSAERSGGRAHLGGTGAGNTLQLGDALHNSRPLGSDL